MMRYRSRLGVFLAAAMALLLFSAELDARGGGGGRGGGGRSFSRSGAASRGALSSRPQGGYSRPRPQANVQRQRPNVSPQRQVQRPRQAAGSIERNGQRRNFDSQARSGSPIQSQDGRLQNRDQRRDAVASNRTDRQANRSGLEERQTARGKQREDIQKNVGDRQDDRQDFLKDRQGDRHEVVDDRQQQRRNAALYRADHYDDHYRGSYGYPRYYDDGDFAAGLVVGGAVVGTAAAIANAADDNEPPTTEVYPETTYASTLPCNATTTVVKGITYYRCGNDWFQRSFSGSQVSYIAVPPPPGY